MHVVYLLNSAAHSSKPTNLAEKPLCQLWPFLLSYPSLPLIALCNKEIVVVKHSGGFLLCIICQLSWENSNKEKSRGLGHHSIYPSACWGFLQSTKHLVFQTFFTCVQHLSENSTFLLFNLYILTLSRSPPSSLRCLHNEHIEFVTGPKSYFHFAPGK